MKAVVCLSGGLDSVAALEFLGPGAAVLALTFDYGQRSANHEIAAAGFFAKRAGVEHRVVCLPLPGGESGLVGGGGEIPILHASDLEDAAVTERTARAVWVPNRNGVFVALAAAYAEDLGCDAIVLGLNREEAATFSDNGKDFLESQNTALQWSTRAPHPQVVSPTIEMDKRQIVEALRARDRAFPFEALWSCYGSGPKRCGVCESCRRLARALGC